MIRQTRRQEVDKVMAHIYVYVSHTLPYPPLAASCIQSPVNYQIHQTRWQEVDKVVCVCVYVCVCVCVCVWVCVWLGGTEVFVCVI